MQVLVTGGCGFIGTNLIKKLLNDGHKVECLDNYSTGKRENELDCCNYIEVDISDNLRRHKGFGLETYQLQKPDIIYHLAAIPRIQPSFLEPTKTFDYNVKGTQNIMEYARTLNVPVVYAGSSSSHGDKYANPYTHSKCLGEEVVTMYNKIYDIPTAICRFYNVYGEYQLTEGAYCTVLGIFERLYNNNEPLTITGDGEQRRDFTHVDDIVDGLIKCGDALSSDGNSMVSGEVFELGRGENHSINEVANMFGEVYPKEYISARKGEYDVTLADYSKANEMLGWNPSRNLVDYVNQILG